VSSETYLVDVREVESSGLMVHVAHADGVGHLLAIGDTAAEALDALRLVAAWQHVVRALAKEALNG
jgi:hypothetical protein